MANRYAVLICHLHLLCYRVPLWSDFENYFSHRYRLWPGELKRPHLQCWSYLPFIESLTLIQFFSSVLSNFDLILSPFHCSATFWEMNIVFKNLLPILQMNLHYSSTSFLLIKIWELSRLQRCWSSIQCSMARASYCLRQCAEANVATWNSLYLFRVVFNW